MLTRAFPRTAILRRTRGGPYATATAYPAPIWELDSVSGRYLATTTSGDTAQAYPAPNASSQRGDPDGRSYSNACLRSRGEDLRPNTG